MKKYAVAIATCGGEVFISFIDGTDKFDALVKYAKKEEYNFSPDDYYSLDELKDLFGDYNQSVEIKEILG